MDPTALRWVGALLFVAAFAGAVLLAAVWIEGWSARRDAARRNRRWRVR